MDELERVSTTIWLEANRQPIEQVKSLKEQMLGITALAEQVTANTTTSEIQDDTRVYLAGSQLRIFQGLVAAHRTAPYDELLIRREESNGRLNASIGEMALTESGAFEEANIVRRDAAWIAEHIPELEEQLADTVAKAITRRQQERRERLDREQQEAAADLEQLDAAIADVSFIPLPLLATPEQQQEAYRTARAIMADDEPVTAVELPPEEPDTEKWKQLPGRVAGDYLARRAGERIALTDVAEAAYGPDDLRAVAKLYSLVAFSRTGQSSPLNNRLAEAGLKLHYEQEPLEGPGRRRFRYFVSAIPNEPKSNE